MSIKSVSVVSLCVATTLVFATQLGRTSRAAQARSASKADAVDGKTIFLQKCESCHFDRSSDKKIGPGLAGLMKQERFKNGMSADEYHLRRVIEHGGKDMPAFRGTLSEKQVRDLILYLKSL